ncbi:MAG: 23S rRNA (guanosine(2251)-2'-O)-methyltransferase RlmB [Pseudomonadota bacterium]|nr:23S rRNA (guanosine(2251)-2'-O)-methyltransferase RlmB [Pseudomonadota bacterium]
MIDIIYGVHPVEAALANPKRRLRRLWLTRNGQARLQASAKTLPLEPEIVHPRELDRKLEPGAVHQGIVLEAEPLPALTLDELEPRGIIAVLDQVTDPHNVGAIMRTCAAFSVKALLTTARHSPEATGVLFKSASGAAELVAYVKVVNLARALEELKSRSFRIVGLHSDAAARIEEEAAARPLALVLGAEGKGLRQLTRQTCDRLVRLDLPGEIRTLNVSNAAALALYALTRGH